MRNFLNVVFGKMHKCKMGSLGVFFSLSAWLKSYLWFLNQCMAWLFLLFCGELNSLEFSVLAAESLKNCSDLFSSYFFVMLHFINCFTRIMYFQDN